MEISQKNLKPNKMGTRPVGRLILQMGLPMMFSMVLQALYNVVDSYFVSSMELGEQAINALAFALPVQMLMAAISVGTAVGVNALLSKSLGEGNNEKASRIAGNGIFLALCTYVVFLIFGLFFVDAYIKTQTKDPIIIEMATEYITICTVFSFGVILFMMYEKLLQSTGKTVLSTIAQVCGAVTNIILDPIMIFGYFGCPAMGVQGAAYATVIGQCVALIMGMLFHICFNKEINGNIKFLKPSKLIIIEIYARAIPAIAMQSLMSVMTFGLNIILGTISSAAVTAYNIYFRIQQFILFAVFGLNNALIPIISYNYGMKNKQRVIDGIKYGIIYIVIVMLLGMTGLQIFAVNLANMFHLSQYPMELCIKAIRTITIGYLLIGVNIACQGAFQAFGKGILSLIISFVRLIVITLPLAWVFSLFSNADSLIWWAFVIAEICAVCISVIFMKKIFKEKISKLN